MLAFKEALGLSRDGSSGGPGVPLCFLYFKMTSHGLLGWGSEEDSFPVGQSSVSLTTFSPAKEPFQLDWFKTNGSKWPIQFQRCLSIQAKSMQISV